MEEKKSLEEQIAEKAFEPQEYENDGERIKQRNADDIIKLAKFASKAKLKTRNAFGALGITRISTPGDDL